MPNTSFHLHLISDSTGETVNTIIRACLVQFEGIAVEEHFWPMVRTHHDLDIVLQEIEAEPGMVVFTIINDDVRTTLLEFCRALQLPCVSVLDTVFTALAGFLGAKASDLPGRQHVMDAEYFHRIEAMNYAMAHDDGQLAVDLTEADVILVGISRTSKTPSCIYLANRGIKAANIPIVTGHDLPPELSDDCHALVVALTEDPVQLVQIRRNRLRMLKADADTDYTDLDQVKIEIAAARRIITENQWPIIDVTRRSIEETAAAIIRLLAERGRAQAR